MRNKLQKCKRYSTLKTAKVHEIFPMALKRSERRNRIFIQMIKMSVIILVEIITKNSSSHETVN